MSKLESIFARYTKKKKQLVKNKKILQINYLPEQFPHRKEQISKIVSIVSVALDKEKPLNMIIYGKTGTGKTAILNYIKKELEKMDPYKDKCHCIYINCKLNDTTYGILYSIISQFLDNSDQIPFTGWSFEKLYIELCKKIESYNHIFIIVLDEIDHMISKKGDLILYYLTEINEHLQKSEVSLIGISNNMKFLEFLESKVKSRLSGENIIFPPYSREQLEDILKERAEKAFEENILEKDVIPYCAALAARNHGDARVAIDLLRTSVDIAERNGDNVVTEAHVKSAKNSIEMDVVDEAVKTLPIQSKIVLMSIVKNTEQGNKVMYTGSVYSIYKELTTIIGISALTQRRITDLISELDTMGIINADIISLNRGRTKEIALSIPKDVINHFKNDPLFKPLENFQVPTQTKLM